MLVGRSGARLCQQRQNVPKSKFRRKSRQEQTAASKLRMERRGEKLDAAREKLAKQKPPKKPGAVKRLAHTTGHGVHGFVHGKLYEVEHENVGTEGAHRSELAAESVYRFGRRKLRKAIREHPAKAVERAESKHIKATADYYYRKTVEEHPEMQEGGAVSRYLQKQKIKRQYAKQAREAARQTAKAVEGTASVTGKLTEKVSAYIKEHPGGLLLLLAAFLLLVVLQSCMSSLVTVGNGVAGAIGASTYAAEDADLLGAEAAYCALEDELQHYLDTYTRTHDYDEYHFDLDTIEHDPYVLLSIVCALHEGEWTLDEVRGTLQIENKMMTGNRVDCLYRVSTDKQVDYNDKSQADIPMQRRECHRFCEKMGWTIVHEEQEDGVSGHKVRAENRDKLQIIKERAKQGKFDILLVFMFDRIGRIADETPFVVEWFVKNGIRVWSTQEGEQRFDNHTDKLTNYIRFWQADGESEKTSIRTKTALGQLVEDGGFKGGLAPYGYDLVKSGRFNKRKHEVFELAVNEAEAAVVRIIFDKYVHEGFGAQRIATYLNNIGYRARTGKMWHHASIRGIICNLTYTGVLRSGESRSQTLPHLQIIEQELFEAAQHIRTSRANSAEQERRVPLNTRGQSLLAGNVFCGHCGSRLALTTNGKAYPCKEDAHRIVKRVRYICYGKTRKQTECDGQTGYTAHILDGIIDKVVRQIFERMKAIPKSEIVNIRYREKMEERKALLKSAKSDYAKAAAELDTLRAEVIKSLRGESAFPQDLLSSLISDCETKCLEVQHTMEAAQAAYDEGQAMLDALNAQYDDIISWADMYDSASMEAKKMIVSCLIRRVEVYRDYRLHIDFNIDFEQFSAGLDISAIAA